MLYYNPAGPISLYGQGALLYPSAPSAELSPQAIPTPDSDFSFPAVAPEVIADQVVGYFQSLGNNFPRDSDPVATSSPPRGTPAFRGI